MLGVGIDWAEEFHLVAVGRPGEGIVTFAHTGRNQHGDVVATAHRKTLVRMRPAEAFD